MRPFPPLPIVTLWTGALLALLPAVCAGRDDDVAGVAQQRQPIAAALINAGEWLAIANERSGSISLVDVERAAVISETRLAKRLSSLTRVPDKERLVATDEETGDLLVIAREAATLSVVQRLQLAPGIASVAVRQDGQMLTVAAPWQRKLFLLELGESSNRLKLRHDLVLSFAPKLQLFLPGNKYLLVADAFGPNLAVVDCSAGTILRQISLPGHNIGGVSLSQHGREVLLTHQQLDESLPTTRENILRGLLMENVLRAISVRTLIDPQINWRHFSSTVRPGSFGAGAGDPAGLAPISTSEYLVAFAGVDEAAITTPNGSELRLPVGRKPTAVIAIKPGRQYAVLNTLDDSITLITHADHWQTQTIALGPRPPLSSADRGERLFFDARLSAEHWLSCHSCHPNGHTNGLRADTRGDQSFGAPKRVLTLRGTALTDKWAWNGDVQDLDVQVKKSLATTIHAEQFSGQDVADLTTFLHTLPHPPPLLPKTSDPAGQAQLARGEKMFSELGCIQCHIPPRTYTSHGVVDVGLSDELGQSKFNPPSLRGVSQNARFFHDNRAPTLESVFTEHGHQLPRELKSKELVDLVRFLKSL